MKNNSERSKYEPGFHYPGTDIPIKKKKKIRRRWKICRWIRISSWIVVPLLFVYAPALLIPWCLFHVLTVFGSADEKTVKAQEKGYEWPPEYSDL